MPQPIRFEHLNKNQFVRKDEEFDLLSARTNAISAVTADAPMEILKNGDAYHIAYNALPDRWFKIIGPASTGYSSAGPGTYYTNWPANYYYAKEIIYPIGDEEAKYVESRVDPNNNYPLIEITGNTEVPTGSIVFARPAFGGTHYEFIFAQGGGSSSATVRLCQVAADAVTSGSIRYYPCTFNELEVATDTWLLGPLVEDVYDCFLVQRLDYDLTVSSAYGPGIYTGLLQTGTKTLTVDAVEYTLPVYATTDSPFLGPDCTIRN